MVLVGRRLWVGVELRWASPGTVAAWSSRTAPGGGGWWRVVGDRSAGIDAAVAKSAANWSRPRTKRVNGAGLPNRTGTTSSPNATSTSALPTCYDRRRMTRHATRCSSTAEVRHHRGRTRPAVCAPRPAARLRSALTYPTHDLDQRLDAACRARPINPATQLPPRRAGHGGQRRLWYHQTCDWGMPAGISVMY